MQYSVVIQYDAVDEIYVASIPELQGCMAHGETREEAMQEILIAMKLQIEVMLDKGIPIPEPLMYVS
ncbi:MAG: type II toxin-antitoxin system HicB family antitoxin [Firmicutes bacterium]|nr:type II toxin-antitoxin system HicB family antitoxin [Bacillota bacterium]